jgi:putative selenium metabolism hydrolase
MLTETQQAQVVACCQELVRAESMTGREADAAAVLERWMRRLDFDEVWYDEYGSVIGRIHGGAGSSGPRLHFDGHLDNVLATTPERWTHPPFGGDVADGKVWGRGSTDMKGSVAAMICAAGFVPRDTLTGTITVSGSVVEEELEGQVLAAMLQRHPADMVVIGESTLLEVGIAEKGRAGIRIVTHGRAAHSASPHLGDNAIYKMADVIARLRALPPPVDDVLGPGILELVEIISRPYPGTSIVPDRCTVKWDRRLVRGETRESVIARIHTALDGLAGVEASYLELAIPCYTGITLRHDDFHPAWDVDQGSALVEAALSSVAAIGETPRICTIPYCSNGSGSAGELSIPSIVLGPGDPALFHVIDEYIAIDQLFKGTEVYQGLTQTLLARR